MLAYGFQACLECLLRHVIHEGYLLLLDCCDSVSTAIDCAPRRGTSDELRPNKAWKCWVISRWYLHTLLALGNTLLLSARYGSPPLMGDAHMQVRVLRILVPLPTLGNCFGEALGESGVEIKVLLIAPSAPCQLETCTVTPRLIQPALPECCGGNWAPSP